MKRLILVFSLVLAISAVGLAQIAVIANPSVDEYTIDRVQFIKIYTLSATKWSSDVSIVAFDLKQDNPVRAKMLDYISKEPLELRRMWLKAVASGSAKAPEAMATEEEVVAKVAATPGSIGYVSTSKIGKGVKVLMRFGK